MEKKEIKNTQESEAELGCTEAAKPIVASSPLPAVMAPVDQTEIVKVMADSARMTTMGIASQILDPRPNVEAAIRLTDTNARRAEVNEIASDDKISTAEKQKLLEALHARDMAERRAECQRMEANKKDQTKAVTRIVWGVSIPTSLAVIAFGILSWAKRKSA